MSLRDFYETRTVARGQCCVKGPSYQGTISRFMHLVLYKKGLGLVRRKPDLLQRQWKVRLLGSTTRYVRA